jgi:VWFA-related protein
MHSVLTTGNLSKRALASLTSVILACACVLSQYKPGDYTFRARTELVLVNVTVRDKSGNPVKDLKRADFTVMEDNKPQEVASLDLEDTDAVASPSVAEAPLLATAHPPSGPMSPGASASAVSGLRNHRLIVLFFDLSSMQPEEIERAVTAAETYVEKRMSPADLVAVISLGNSLTINQEFTSDRALLKRSLQALNPETGEGFEEGPTGTTEGTPDTAQPFTADDTEYNIFNTDRRLETLRTIADKLAAVEEEKSLIYFSSGMDRTGIENQSELRAAINAAVRSNLSIYTIDLRGLQAMPPGGEAQNASLRGTSPFSGKAMLAQYDTNFTTQETLVTLAADTGGRAYLDSNDFGRVFTGVQQDTSLYYVLGYHSTNPARDGKYHRITVKVSRPGLKIQFRRGYYAPADFQHSTHENRERQLHEELASEFPSTDLPIYLSMAYFRISKGRFYVPVSLVVPGSQVPFARNKDHDRATLDVLGAVTDPEKRPITQIRDSVKLSLNTTELVQRKNVQYNTGFLLPAGKYHLKFIVRENQTGRFGSFETDMTVPDFKGTPLKMSSVVLASQLRPNRKHINENPLIRDGSEIVPNVTHVFSADQHLFLYFEVYDPGRQLLHPIDNPADGGDAIHLLSNVAFFKGNSKAYETPIVESDQLNAPLRRAAVFKLDVPLTSLKPGFYTCQVNVIDYAAGQFRFPRLALLVR